MANQVQKRKRGVVKGAPSGLVISLLVHAGAFMLAGLLVVFTVVQKEGKKFVPPKPVDRPKMKLKKPKVKVKKSAKPKSTTRIVTKVQKANMPNIQLPEMSGIGEGLAGGVGGFDIMPDLEEVTLMGGAFSTGNDLEATFYDFKRYRDGSPMNSSHEGYLDTLRKFISSGWKPSKLARYYRSPQKMYPTSVLLPSIPSYIGPRCFNESTKGYHWAVHYTGELVYPEDIKFRFWGYGDNVLVVAVDGEIVLNACRGENKYIAEWNGNTAEEGTFLLGGSDTYAFGGRWIELKAGEPRKLDIVIGEVYGGGFNAMLLVQEYGVKYPSRGSGSSDPMYPMFMTEEPSLDLKDAIIEVMPENEVALTGPVFKDYISKTKNQETADVEPSVGNSAAAADESGDEAKRVWTTADGKSFEADFVTIMGDKLVFKTSRDKAVKIPKVDISDADMEYIVLQNPPEFTVDFIKTSKSILNRYPLGPQSLDWNVAPPQVNDYTFGARVKQAGTSKVDYEHELTIEYFAVGKQKHGDAFILLDRQESTFTPSKENGIAHSFTGDPIEFLEFGRIGKKYVGYLVTITDSQGKIIQHSATKPWLWENLENLKKMPVGRFMDETCRRTLPTPQERTY